MVCTMIGCHSLPSTIKKKKKEKHKSKPTRFPHIAYNT